MGLAEGMPLKFIDTKKPENPGDTYVWGLRAIMEKRGVSLEDAAEISKKDLLANQGYEHLTPTELAVRYIRWEDKQKLNGTEEDRQKIIDEIVQSRDFVRRYCLKLLKQFRCKDPESLSEEFAQDTILKAIKDLDPNKIKSGSVKSWIGTIAHNLVINYFRRSKLLASDLETSVPQVRESDSHNGQTRDIEMTTENPEDALIKQIDLEKIKSKLIPRDQAIFKLLKEGYTYSEIGEKLGIPAGTVGRVIHELPKKVRKNSL